ncbi:MAG: HAMP domain-containing histidine kinase [Chloroflexi bacterium]|nr:HAMP domain-containing histidine kinase [Chloroflexota bacterium]
MLPAKLSDRLRLIQWVLPIIITALAAVYQLGPARYVHDNFGTWSHYGLEVLFYGTTGPIGVWLTLRIVRGWVEAKEQAEAEVYRLNAELQQRVEERTQELRDKNEALAAANTELQQLDRMKSEFVSLVSHELRAPLTNMRGALELMEDGEAALSPNCLRILGIVNEQASRLARMVDEFAARNARRKFRRPRGSLQPRLWADPDRLHEVIANLVDNAVKYSPDDGEVMLEVEARDGEGWVSVSDSGPGIPFDQRSRLFEKFHRLDSGDAKETYGYGLGLYLSRRLVEAMGGRIWVESEPGRGTTFRFALPLADGQ